MDGHDAVQHAPLDFAPLTGSALDEAAWRVRTAQTFAPLDLHPISRPFWCRMEATTLGPVSVVRIEQSSAVVARTPALIRQRGSELVKVSLQLEGDCFIEQDGRAAILHPGDVALYDASRPYTLRYDTDFRLIVLAFPYDYLGIPREELAQVTATAFPLESPLGGVVNPFLAGLARSLVQLPEADAQRLTQTALDLLVTVISGELRTGVQQDPRRQLLHDVLATIDELLPDPDLSPQMIAQRHFISTRHLHALFADRDITVSAWIRRRRLEHIRRDLADPTMRQVPIAAVAARSGLTNPAHFSRMFRQTFGATPSEYRAQTMGGHQ